jgi:NAD(P)H-dependent FMN reductase
VCGSLQAKSANLDLLNAAIGAAPAGVEVLVDDSLRHLPLFNPDLENDDPPPAVQSWRRALAGGDAILIASPEYGHSLTGALKNGIDWVIGSGELEKKVVAITCVVPHQERGRLGLAALRQTLGAVRATIVGGDPLERGPGLAEELAQLLRALVAAAERQLIAEA